MDNDDIDYFYSPMHQPADIKPINTKKKKFTNIEPNFDQLITDNLCSITFKNWIESNLDKQINSQIVKQFFLSFFALLSQYNSCFERGAFIFQNDTNVLFNILTFDKLKITTSFNCDDPLSEVVATAPVGHPITPANVHSTATGTHIGPINSRLNFDAEAGPCVPAKSFPGSGTERKNHKFERIFDGDLSLDDVCNKCIVKTGKHDHRRVILYYPYVLTSAPYFSSDFTDKKSPGFSKLNFLFVKFESQPVSGTVIQKTAHGLNLVTRKVSGLFSSATSPAAVTNNSDSDADSDSDASSRLLSNSDSATATSTTTAPLDERREDDPVEVYSRSQQAKDISFYRSLGLSTKTLEWYNNNIRIGQEFFVSQQLLEYLLMHYLFTNYTCPGKGGKLKRNKTRNKKTNKKGNKKTNKKTNKKSRKSRKSRKLRKYN